MGFLGGGSKGPSQAQIMQMQEQAAQKERDRLAMESAARERSQQQNFMDQEKRRRMLAETEGVEDDEEQRRRFLAGA